MDCLFDKALAVEVLVVQKLRDKNPLTLGCRTVLSALLSKHYFARSD